MADTALQRRRPVPPPAGRRAPAAHGRQAAPRTVVAGRADARRTWLSPEVIDLSVQRGDGEWHFCPWILAGRDDLYDDV